MPDFEDAWSAVAYPGDGEFVSTALRQRLEAVYSNVLSSPRDLLALKSSLQRLLEYLAGDGRTNANCRAVDAFFADSRGWDWVDQELPDDFHDVLTMMGEALHDAVQAPDVAGISSAYLSNSWNE
jgi:DNA polymerase III delta subunit